MRELTLDEIEAVSGGVSLADAWNSLKSAFSAAGDFFGFDGSFGYQGGGGSQSFGGFFGALGDAAGYAWNAPNSALGLIYSAVGYLYDQTFGDGEMYFAFDDGVIRAINHPFMLDYSDFPGDGAAITLGHVQIYADYRPGIFAHENGHTTVGNFLGIGYLPAYFAGGIYSILNGGEFFGAGNPFEAPSHEVPSLPF